MVARYGWWSHWIHWGAKRQVGQHDHGSNRPVGKATFQALDYRVLPPETDPDTAAPGEGISLSSIPLNCDILAPADGAETPAGPVTVHGWALAGDGHGIGRVDVSLDGGHTWRQADLQPATSRWAWRLWSLIVEAQSGPMTLTARAWNDTGSTQPESPAALWNPRGYANNAWSHVEVNVSASAGG